MDRLVAYKHNGIIKWRKAPVEAPVGNYRDYLGESLREVRKAKAVKMRDINGVSLGYISEVERGMKEASSEVLEVMCSQMGISMSEVLRMTADKLEKVGK